MRELLPSLKLIRGSVLRTLLLGFLLSCVASLAAIGLLGLSGWFITMSALVGIAGSTSFSYLTSARISGITGASVAEMATICQSHAAVFTATSPLYVSPRLTRIPATGSLV